MQLGAGQTMLFGALSGSIAEMVTYPFEVIRRKMQLGSILASRKIPLTALSALHATPMVRSNLVFTNLTINYIT